MSEDDTPFSRFSDGARKGGEPEARGTVQTSTAKRRGRSALSLAASGAGGAGLSPQKVLRTFWDAPKSCPAKADAGPRLFARWDPLLRIPRPRKEKAREK